RYSAHGGLAARCLRGGPGPGAGLESRPSLLPDQTMECVAGSCEYRLPGSTEWQTSSVGHAFSVPGNTRFEIRVAEAYHYICHYE
ncbi:MAG: DUF1255 family protein, partial [Betaproteobacteria bacterium]|nr:DUF1255 family protein [Betaproteobacteria bacterium]